MAPQKSPAFSFYAKDFVTGTSTMSLQEVGAYIRLLAYQWDVGSVPTDPSDRARILGCAKAQERELWKKVSKKFVLRNDVYLNERLEEERQKQTDRRQRLSDNGKLGGRPQKANEKLDESKSFPETKANGKQLKSLPSSSSFSGKDHNTQTARANGHGNGANAPGSLGRDHRFHAICGPRMRVCLTDATAAKLVEKWGGLPDEALPFVREFCDWLEQKIGDGAKGDFLWLIQHFEAFMDAQERVPLPPPPKAKTNGVAAQINAWGNDD